MRTSVYLLTTILLLQCKQVPEKLYTLLDPAKTGVSFSNDITIADSLVLSGYEYIYNGGGVAVGDINNDGLQDLYFTGNLVSSRLYLNKSITTNGHTEIVFEDITEKAGVGTKTWANGVTMVDINQDGYKDIYVSVGGHQFTPESDRPNLLFINNQNGTFTESAAAYRLDDRGYGIQSAFFDYDHDGDLDMYLLRNSFVTYSRNTAKPKSILGEAPSTDKLFRNESIASGHPIFTDVSQEAHILIEGFGLGVNIADFNEDGWPDVYVSNDFISNDLMWINNQDGTFTNRIKEYLKHQTFNGMGNDIADYNNDGLADIVVLDMLPPDNKRWKLTPRGNSYDEFKNGLAKGYEPQYVRNTLQLNQAGTGQNTFSEIGQLAGVAATDWSWSSLFIDLDHDGWKDLFITNGYGKDITNLDFIVYGDKSQIMGMDEASVKERQKLLNEIPGISVHNYVFGNHHDLTFEDKTEEWSSLKPTFSNGAAYADLDNDGDLELITNNIDEPASIWQSNLNQSALFNGNHYIRVEFNGSEKNREGFGTKIKITHHGLSQYQYFNPFRGYLSSMEPRMLFGIGADPKVDSLEVIWPDGKRQLLLNLAANTTIKLDYDNSAAPVKTVAIDTIAFHYFEDISSHAGVEYHHVENNFVDFKVQPLLPIMHSRNGPGIAVGDLNGDSLEDFYIGSAAGHVGGLFIQQPNGGFRQGNVPDMDSISDQMGVLLFDADQDLDLDLYIVHGGSEQRLSSPYYQDKLYLNDGRGIFTLSKASLPVIDQSGSCVNACDFDHDGDLDIFRGSRLTPAAYPTAPQSILLINEKSKGQLVFKKSTASFLQQLGMVTSSLWTDFDNDGWEDLIITGEYMPLTFIHNNKGVLEDVTAATGLKNTRGWWNSISAGDFDHDGDMDYLAGNLGLNTRFKASVKEPLCIYAKDYNEDGTIDPVMSQYIQGVKYTNHTRDILISQITAMRARFRTYTAYSNASFEETLTPEETADAYVVTAEDFETAYIENFGRGQFKIHSLPLQAQFAPIYGICIEDWDQDGYLDALMIGNAYSMEVITGSADANPGLYLKGNGKGEFAVAPMHKTGFRADQDAKGVARLGMEDGHSLILVANNDGPLQILRHGTKARYFKPRADEVSATIFFKDNTKRKCEFYHGSTYLSNGSNTIIIPPNASKIDVFNTQGKLRSVDLNSF